MIMVLFFVYFVVWYLKIEDGFGCLFGCLFGVKLWLMLVFLCDGVEVVCVVCFVDVK